MTHSRRQLLELLDESGITLSRALGQNFVADPNTVRRIVRLAGVQPGDAVVELGAGIGSLTLALAEAGAKVVAVETDRHVVPLLRRLVSGLDVTVVQADALRLGWVEALTPPGSSWAMVSNLPYNIAVPLVLDVLAGVPAVTSMLVMVQREVAERLASGPGSKVYGIPSVKRAWWADATVVAKVPATVFIPVPRVESALLRLVRRPPPPTALTATAVFKVVETAFGQRRKMLRRSLAVYPSFEAAADAAGVRSDCRPEELGLEQWVRLAEQLLLPGPSAPSVAGPTGL